MEKTLNKVVDNCAMPYRQLHVICKKCKKNSILKKEYSPKGSKIIYPADSFIINCKGIPNDPKKLIDEKILPRLGAAELDEVLAAADPIYWAKKYIDWTPRISQDKVEYQKAMVCCTAKVKTFRVGRRCGKTDSLCAKAWYLMMTNHNFKCLAVAPYKSQVELIFNRMRELARQSGLILDSIQRDVSSPYHEIKLFNGSYIRGFSSGTSSSSNAVTVRGQPADVILLDEADYLAEGDIDSVMAIMTDHKDVELWMSSTPTGKRGKFFVFCNEPRFKEFHYPAYVNPNWNEEMEINARETHSDLAYIHEILAEWGEEVTGVFQKAYIDEAKKNYNYSDLTPTEGWQYSIGVDWNSDKTGTEILVLGWNSEEQRFQVVATDVVAKKGWTQVLAIQKLVDLNRIWKPRWIYVDEGYGDTQIQIMKKFGFDQSGTRSEYRETDGNLRDIVKGINMSSKMEIHDLIDGQLIKTDTKPFMVENAVRKFERQMVDISMHDKTLLDQLFDFQVLRRTSGGKPVYQPGTASIGDHRLTALMLALLAFQAEGTPFGAPQVVGRVVYNEEGFFGNKIKNEEELPGEMIIKYQCKPSKKPQTRLQRKPRTRDTLSNDPLENSPAANTSQKRKLWSWDGFMSDAPKPESQKMNNNPLRGRKKPSRRSW